MNRSEPLRAILVQAERHAPSEVLAELAWMLAAFEPDHAVRKQASNLAKLQQRIATQRPCRTDIGTVMRVMTNRGAPGLVGEAARIIHGQLQA